MRIKIVFLDVIQDMINGEQEVILVKVVVEGRWLGLGERGEKRVYGRVMTRI